MILPTADEKTVTESGQPLAKAKGIKPVSAQPNQVLLEVQPGVYEFKSALGALGRL